MEDVSAGRFRKFGCCCSQKQGALGKEQVPGRRTGPVLLRLRSSRGWEGELHPLWPVEQALDAGCHLQQG